MENCREPRRGCEGSEPLQGEGFVFTDSVYGDDDKMVGDSLWSLLSTFYIYVYTYMHTYMYIYYFYCCKY